MKCKTPLPPEILSRGSLTFATDRELMPCSACGALTQVLVLPALFDQPELAGAGEALGSESEASCYYHSDKQAAVCCDRCGRFLCRLCEVKFSGETLCSPCIQTGKEKREIKFLENQRVIYEQIALTLSALPLICWPLTAVTAPAALFIAISCWKKPGSIVVRNKIRSILAIFFSFLQIAAWSFGIYWFVFR